MTSPVTLQFWNRFLSQLWSECPGGVCSNNSFSCTGYRQIFWTGLRRNPSSGIRAIPRFKRQACANNTADGQSNLTKVASNHWRKSRPPFNTMILGFPWGSNPSRTSIRSAVFAQRSHMKPRDTDWQTSGNIDRSSPHFMHSMRLKKCLLD